MHKQSAKLMQLFQEMPRRTRVENYPCHHHAQQQQKPFWERRTLDKSRDAINATLQFDGRLFKMTNVTPTPKS